MRAAAAGVGIAGSLVAALVMPALGIAASPTPSPLGGGDPRSSGAGPGLVGDPLTAIVVVAAIAILTVAATLTYIRVTADRDRGSPP